MTILSFFPDPCTVFHITRIPCFIYLPHVVSSVLALLSPLLSLLALINLFHTRRTSAGIYVSSIHYFFFYQTTFRPLSTPFVTIAFDPRTHTHAHRLLALSVPPPSVYIIFLRVIAFRFHYLTFFLYRVLILWGPNGSVS